MQEASERHSPGLALVFRGGAIWVALVSAALFFSLLVRPSAEVNPLNIATIVGAPLAYWMVANPFRLEWLRWIAPAVFIAAIGPAAFGWIIFLYLPGLPGIITGLKWR